MGHNDRPEINYRNNNTNVTDMSVTYYFCLFVLPCWFLSLAVHQIAPHGVNINHWVIGDGIIKGREQHVSCHACGLDLHWQLQEENLVQEFIFIKVVTAADNLLFGSFIYWMIPPIKLWIWWICLIMFPEPFPLFVFQCDGSDRGWKWNRGCGGNSIFLTLTFRFGFLDQQNMGVPWMFLTIFLLFVKQLPSWHPSNFHYSTCK